MTGIQTVAIPDFARELADDTIRRQWEQAQKINIHGEPIDEPDNLALSDAAWMKQNLARAKMALPNGNCGLPLQQSCPHANACLTCPLFITTDEFLPEHHKQLEQTRQIIARAEAAGNTCMVEMNRAVETNLTAIIGTLNSNDDTCACDTCHNNGACDAC